MDKGKMETVDEYTAAGIRRQSVQTLRNERHLGKGCPYLKLGRSARYLITDIERFLLKNRVDPEARMLTNSDPALLG